jgi:hypothetical protein
MNYNPMQYSLARAENIRQTTQGIGGAVIDFGKQLSAIAKKKDVVKRIDTAYKSALTSFIESATQNGMSSEKAAIEARKRIIKPFSDLEPEAQMKMLVDSSLKADAFLDKIAEENKTKQQTQQKSEAAQKATEPSRSYGPEQPVDLGRGPGSMITEQDVTSEKQAPQYQEQALSRYGEMAAGGEALPQSTKELQNQPAISALPKTPEPQKPMSEYEKASLKLREDANNISRIRANKGDSAEFDKNLRYAQDRQDDVAADQLRYSERLAKLRQAKVKLKAGKKLDDKLLQFMSEEGMNAVSPDVGELDGAISQYQDLLDQVEDVKVQTDETVKELIETKSLARALKKGREKKAEVIREREQENENVVTAAKNWIKGQSPSLFYSNVGPTAGIQKIINELPSENFKSVIQTKVEEARKMNVSDEAIYRRLLQ